MFLDQHLLALQTGEPYEKDHCSCVADLRARCGALRRAYDRLFARVADIPSETFASFVASMTFAIFSMVRPETPVKAAILSIARSFVVRNFRTGWVRCTGSARPVPWHGHQVGTPKDEGRYRLHFGRLGGHGTLMEYLPIDFISRLQIGRQQAVLPLLALDHPAHVLAIPHEVMVRQRG
jgi:hypothetical protein